MTRPIRYGAAAVLLATLDGLSACTRGRHASASAAPSASAMTDEQILVIARQYAQCLRDHGITDVAEPRIQDGRLVGRRRTRRLPGPGEAGRGEAGRGEAGRGVDRVRVRCGRTAGVDVLPAGVMSRSQVSAADLEKMGKFAACLRQHGYPEWPDPNGEGFFPIQGTALEGALKSDQGQEAKRTCQKYYGGAIKTANP